MIGGAHSSLLILMHLWIFFYYYLCLKKTPKLALKGKSGKKGKEMYVVTYEN